MKDESAERRRQFETCYEFCKNREEDTIVFGGDLNARDSEVPPELHAKDCWILAGKPSTEQYTWDLTVNTNSFLNGAKPRCRFDRLYSLGVARIRQFQLVGREPVPGLPGTRFASDHFGVLVSIELVGNM
jgi:endonuclease/exonuclease/phosphatase family metal-dependent hydrolase